MQVALLLVWLLLGGDFQGWLDAAATDTTESADVTKMDGGDTPPKP